MMRHYRDLWIVLASALVVIFLISINGGVAVGPLKLKSSGVVETLTAAVEEPEAATSGGSAEPPVFEPAPVDTARQVILFAGDSMTEGLYPRLAAYCEATGHTLYTVIWYSSTTEIWANSKLLKKYIAQLQPTFIFFSLGGNELFISNIKERRQGFVKEIVSEIGAIPYVWIGPPNWKPDTGINDLIASCTGQGCFFLTNGMKFNRKKDGAHPTRESSVVWMDSIMRWMPEHAAHPILMNRPEKTAGKAKKVYIHQPGSEP